MDRKAITIGIEGRSDVSGLSIVPDSATACLVLAHGAGAGMAHPFMDAVATGLSTRGVATLRYQFPFMEAGSKRPDAPALAQAAVRAAVAEAARLKPGLPLFAGGKSFGGRMTSQAQAAKDLPGVRGLVFFGFPLHPSGKPAATRAAHLDAVDGPMLFVQGTRDALADSTLMVTLIAHLSPRATLMGVEGADHAFHVPKRSGQTDLEVLARILDATIVWMGRILSTR